MALIGVLPGPRFRCPVCGFIRGFPATRGASGARRHCRCPKCGAAERHRLQRLVVERIRDRLPPGARGLQFAPDPMTPVLRGLCAELITADILPRPGSIVLDMTRMDCPTMHSTWSMPATCWNTSSTTAPPSPRCIAS